MQNSKKGNNYFMNAFNRISALTNYRQIFRFENATFRYIFFRRTRLEIIHWGMK